MNFLKGMKRTSILLIGLILAINLVSALDCQYTTKIPYEEELLVFYENGVKLDYNLLEAKDFTTGVFNMPFGTWTHRPSFNIHNNYNKQVNVTVSYIYLGKYNSVEISVDPQGYTQISYESNPTNVGIVDPNLILYEIHNPGLESKREKLTLYNITCKECPENSGALCLDDGVSCQKNSECGSSYCVRNICSLSDSCFNNDCKCSSDEVQCDDNKRCVKRSAVPIDVKPECNKPPECITGYINSETGLCGKSPAQIQEEENQKLSEELARKEKERRFLIYAILGLAFIIIFGVVVIWYLKNKHEEAKQKTIQKEIELEGRKIQREEYELNELKEQIKEIERQRHKTQQEIKELENLKSKRDDLIADIENQYEKITKPFPDPQASNRLVVINPYLGGYKCFYEKGLELENYPTSSLVHRWVWKEHNGRYPRPGYHIHHIDEDKYNNDPKNLEGVEGEEHYCMHKSNSK